MPDFKSEVNKPEELILQGLGKTDTR